MGYRDGIWGIAFGLSNLSKNPTLVKFKEKISPFNLFTKVFEHYDYVYILESAEGPRKLAEYSFIGFDPRIVLKVKDGKAEIRDRIRGENTVLEVEDPMSIVRGIVGKLAVTLSNFRFLGGVVGYISYDAVRYWEKLPSLASDDLGFPDIEMAVFLDGIIFDHKKGEAFYFYADKNRLEELLSIVKGKCDVEPFRCSEPKVNIAKEDFEKLLLKLKST